MLFYVSVVRLMLFFNKVWSLSMWSDGVKLLRFMSGDGRSFIIINLRFVLIWFVFVLILSGVIMIWVIWGCLMNYSVVLFWEFLLKFFWRLMFIMWSVLSGWKLLSEGLIVFGCCLINLYFINMYFFVGWMLIFVWLLRRWKFFIDNVILYCGRMFFDLLMIWLKFWVNVGEWLLCLFIMSFVVWVLFCLIFIFCF